MSDLHNSVVMITGASGNVGRGVVKAFHDAGAKIALVDMNKDRLDSVVAEMGGDEAMRTFACDISDVEAFDGLVAEIDAAFGRIDHLVHTVGGFAMGDPVHAGNLSVFDKMMALNARLTYLVCGRVAAYMIDKGIHGSLTMVLARAGLAGGKDKAAYTASKAAAMRIMESMAAELKPHRIRVNGVSPSTVDTPPNRESMPNADFDAWVKPEQIGALMVHLAQNDAMHGANVEINAWS